MRLIMTVLLLASANPCFAAQPYAAATRVMFSNQNWFPLSEADMKRAAVDRALAELSRTGNFIFLSETESTPQVDARGLLILHLSLIEPAELVKLTLTLQIPESATIIASASGSLTGKDRKGIFQAFESVGHAAAINLKEKLAALPAREAGTAAISWDTPVAKAYKRAQQLKSQHRFQDAYEAFAALLQNKDEGAEYWVKLARDELAYALPMLEADHLMLEIYEHLASSGQAAAHFSRIEGIYRKVLQNNPGSPKRILEVQRKLDALGLTRLAVKKSMKMAMLSSVRSLRTVFIMEYMETGKWPPLERVTEILADMGGRLEIKKYDPSPKGYTLVLKDLRFEREVTIRGDHRRFEVE